MQNVFAVHRFAQGAADWRSGPRWSILSVLYPVHPFPLRGTSPQGETKDMREKTASHMLHVLLQHFPLWWLAPPPFPRKRGHYKAPLCCELLMKGLFFRALFCPLNRGKSGAARIGGGERSEPITRMLIMPYDKEGQSRNADFILIARRAPPQPSGPKAPSNLRTLRPIGPVNPKNLFHNLFLQPFYTTCGEAAPLFLIIVKMSHFIHERRVYNKIKYSKYIANHRIIP